MDPEEAYGQKHSPASPTDLFSSGKVVAEAAQSAFRRDAAGHVDTSKLAAAAGDLLHAASHYGHLEDKPYGAYIEKAEGYLHQYGSSHSSTHPAAEPPPPHQTHSAATHHGGEDDGSGGGFGDYTKLAQGFLNKPGHHGGGESEGGAGDYLKMAEGFLGGGSGHHGSKDDDSEGGVGDYLKLAQGFMKKH